MLRIFLYTCIACILTCTVSAQGLLSFRVEEINLQYKAPKGAQTEINPKDEEAPFVLTESEDPDIAIFVYPYEATPDSIDEYFESAASDIAFVSDEIVETKTINGMPALIKSGKCWFLDEHLGAVLVSFAKQDKIFIAYIITDMTAFANNKTTMIEIAKSFSPLLP